MNIYEVLKAVGFGNTQTVNTKLGPTCVGYATFFTWSDETRPIHVKSSILLLHCKYAVCNIKKIGKPHIGVPLALKRIT